MTLTRSSLFLKGGNREGRRMRSGHITALISILALVQCSDGLGGAPLADRQDERARYDEFLRQVHQPTEDDCAVFEAVAASNLPASGSDHVRPFSDIRPLEQFLTLNLLKSPGNGSGSVTDKERRRMVRQLLSRHTSDFRDCKVPPGKPFRIDWSVGASNSEALAEMPRERLVAVLWVSPAGYSADGNRAIVYAVNYCGTLCGQGGYFSLSRVASGWRVESYDASWVS